MTNQEILNNASRQYIDLQEYIKKLLKDSNKKFDEKKIFDSLDILLQIILMYLSVSNSNVSKSELNFIKLLTTEKDILINYNKLSNSNIRWEDLRNTYMNPSEFEALINKTYSLFSNDIDSLIILLAGRDSLTKDNDLEVIEEYLKKILYLFIEIESDTDSKNINYILDNIFVKRYKEIKQAFSAINIKF